MKKAKYFEQLLIIEAFLYDALNLDDRTKLLLKTKYIQNVPNAIKDKLAGRHEIKIENNTPLADRATRIKWRLWELRQMARVDGALPVQDYVNILIELRDLMLKEYLWVFATLVKYNSKIEADNNFQFFIIQHWRSAHSNGSYAWNTFWWYRDSSGGQRYHGIL